MSSHDNNNVVGPGLAVCLDNTEEEEEVSINLIVLGWMNLLERDSFRMKKLIEAWLCVRHNGDYHPSEESQLPQESVTKL